MIKPKKTINECPQNAFVILSQIMNAEQTNV